MSLAGSQSANATQLTAKTGTTKTALQDKAKEIRSGRERFGKDDKVSSSQQEAKTPDSKEDKIDIAEKEDAPMEDVAEAEEEATGQTTAKKDSPKEKQSSPAKKKSPKVKKAVK